MRRKAGALVPLEQQICLAALTLQRRGTSEFHGYEIAKRLADASDHKLLTAYGTLYRALGRLENMGLLQSRWEASEVHTSEGRPARRLYQLTAAGELAAREARRTAPQAAAKRAKRRLAPA
jgi:DNA-binding PadR family transcriptional regulator